MIEPSHLQYFLDIRASTGGDDIAAIKAVRARFGLDLVAAKEIMLKASGVSSSLAEHQGQFASSLSQALDELESGQSAPPTAAAASGIRHYYARLMRRANEPIQATDEAVILERLLATAPGVVRVKSIEPHPKGGFRVTLDLHWSALDDFIGCLDSNNWMLVM